MNVKYFVVSLPRTGTTSLSKMARMCGLNPKHAPHFYWKNHLDNNQFNFFSDTPIYCPSVVEEICSMTEFESRFIYIEKDFESIFKSWVRMGLLNNYNSFYGNEKNFDFVSYNNAFQNKRLSENNFENIFTEHRNIITQILDTNSKKLF